MASSFDNLIAATPPATPATLGPSSFDHLLQPTTTTQDQAAAPPPPPTPARFGPQAKAALEAAPPSDGLSLSDTGSLLHEAASGVTPLMDMYTAAMDAGPSNYLGFTHVPGDTFSERWHNALAAKQQESTDFTAKHPYAAGTARGLGMVGGDILRAPLGPLAPAEVGMETGLSVAPHKSFGGDAVYTAAGAPLGYLAAKGTQLILKPISALASRVMRYVNPEDPAETYVKYATTPTPAVPPPVAPHRPPTFAGAVAKTALKMAPGAVGALLGSTVGAPFEGGVLGMAAHAADPLTEYFTQKLAAKAAARTAAAALPPRVPTAPEWQRYWARPAPRVSPPPPSFPRLRQALPLVAGQEAAKHGASPLARIMVQHYPWSLMGGDQQ